jgi:hypothetical protein
MNTSADTTDNGNHFSSRLKMPTFAGTSEERIATWLKTFDRWCILSNYQDAHKSSLLPFVLVGSAAKIFNAWDATNSVPNNWTDVKAKLEAQFADKSRIKIYEATLLKRKMLSSETFEEYFADVLSLCSSIKTDMPESDKIHHLLKGLPESIVQFIIFKDPQTTEELLKAYTTHKTAKLLTSNIEPESQTSTASAAAALDSVTSALVSKFETLLSSQNDKISELQALVAQKSSNDNKCFRCHELGHMAKDCHLSRTPQPAPRNRDRDSRNSNSPRYRDSSRDRDFPRNRDSQVNYPSRRTPSPGQFRPRTPLPGRYRNDFRQPSYRENEYSSSSYRSRTPERQQYQSSSRYSQSPGRYFSSTSPHRNYQSPSYYPQSQQYPYYYPPQQYPTSYNSNSEN